MSQRKIKDWSVREFKRMLVMNGYTLTRTSGDHCVYTKKGYNHISIPNTNINMMVARRVIKENNLNTFDFIK